MAQQERLRIEQVDFEACHAYWDNDLSGLITWRDKTWWFTIEGKEIFKGEVVTNWQQVAQKRIEDYFINLEMTVKKFVAITVDGGKVESAITWCYASSEDEARQTFKNKIEFDGWNRARMAMWGQWQQQGYQVRLRNDR